ncbi:hypothetical protein B0H13DRAFT_1884623 [Mycena leptocephala]|nr:hypothetical protein B0H13DRAFT_1884623 [Mycena leptocephala]
MIFVEKPRLLGLFPSLLDSGKMPGTCTSGRRLSYREIVAMEDANGNIARVKHESPRMLRRNRQDTQDGRVAGAGDIGWGRMRVAGVGCKWPGAIRRRARS